MANVIRRLRHSESFAARESFCENGSVPSTDLQHVRKFAQQHASECRLKFSEAPVGPARVVQPTETDRMLPIVNRLVALAVVLIAPCLLPHVSVIGGQQATLTPC